MPIEVKLYKGYVGITADGRKATVEYTGASTAEVTVKGYRSPIRKGEEVTYRIDGTPQLSDHPELLRIVAPYPSEKPFDVNPEAKRFYVLDTQDGSIVKTTVSNNSSDAVCLSSEPWYDPDWVYWFTFDGLCRNAATNLRVLGPVEEKKPEPEKRGMTKKRWEEILVRVEQTERVGFGRSHEMLHDLFHWINGFEQIALQYDPEPVEYEPHDIVSMARAMSEGNGLTFGGTKKNPFRILYAGLDEVQLEDISHNSQTTRVSYAILAVYHVWQIDDTPVARKKNET